MKQSISKNIFNKSILLGVILFSSSVFSQIQLLDKVIAVVDSGIIMESQLNDRVQSIVFRLRQNGTELPPKKELEKQVLERLIVEEIQLQMAERAGIKISDAELNSTISRIASQNQMNLEDFKESLESNDESYRGFRESIEREMIISRVQRARVGRNIQISEQEIENFLNSEEGRSKLAEQYDVQQILISLKGDASDQSKLEAEKKAEDIIVKLSNGESFEKLAATYSAGQNALEGGSLGWRKESELPSLFAETVKGLKEGEISSPIRSGAGLHILKLKGKKGNTVKYEDQTLVRHILVQPSEIRSESQTELLINEIHQKLEEGEDFKILARQYSEDPGSKMNGGELGWSPMGTFTSQFEKVMIESKLNEVSKPFKSQFGWHILEVLDRRNEDVSEEQRKDGAFRIIFDRKFEQELERTLIEMRAEAFVDIKLDL
tara:strand:- start:4186 stop:5490 length:1305 start_codon:yes stop_codon:yes gene_type:complete